MYNVSDTEYDAVWHG